MYPEEEYLALSGLQHFSFCRRQWALIHLAQEWAENLLTVQGDLIHSRAHDENLSERRGDTIIARGLRVHSSILGLSGACDVIEFHACENGFPLAGNNGLWSCVPVEYKRGRSKVCDADRLQLCAQALCLEEMFCCDIPQGFLFYNQTRSRESVDLNDVLRGSVKQTVMEMHKLFSRGYIPKPKKTKACNACSLKEKCLPQISGRESVFAYYERRLGETE